MGQPTDRQLTKTSLPTRTRTQERYDPIVPPEARLYPFVESVTRDDGVTAGAGAGAGRQSDAPGSGPGVTVVEVDFRKELKRSVCSCACVGWKRWTCLGRFGVPPPTPPLSHNLITTPTTPTTGCRPSWWKRSPRCSSRSGRTPSPPLPRPLPLPMPRKQEQGRERSRRMCRCWGRWCRRWTTCTTS